MREDNEPAHHLPLRGAGSMVRVTGRGPPRRRRAGAPGKPAPDRRRTAAYSGSKRAWKNRRCFGSYTMRSPGAEARLSYTLFTDSATTSMCAWV